MLHPVTREVCSRTLATDHPQNGGKRKLGDQFDHRKLKLKAELTRCEEERQAGTRRLPITGRTQGFAAEQQHRLEAKTVPLIPWLLPGQAVWGPSDQGHRKLVAFLMQHPVDEEGKLVAGLCTSLESEAQGPAHQLGSKATGSGM